MICQWALTLSLILSLRGVHNVPVGCVVLAKVTVTGYSNEDGAFPFEGLTASGLTTTHGVVAAGPDIPFKTRVFIPSYGYGVVADRGGLVTDRCLDIWFSSHSDAVNYAKHVEWIVFFE